MAEKEVQDGWRWCEKKGRGKEREQREVMIYPAMDWWSVGHVFVVHLDATCFWREE